MKSLAVSLAHAAFLIIGLLQYWIFGKNNVRAHRAMIYFFCRSGGKFNDWCNRIISAISGSMPIRPMTGVLGDMSGSAGKVALAHLIEKGYLTFERALPPHVCDRLMQFALNTPGSVRPMDGEESPAAPRFAVFDAKHPIAVRYDYLASDLLANSDIQNLLADRSILRLAEMYLEARPRFDILSMWWHTNFHTQPDSEAAQFFHFDLDRLKWLKVFVYLTDVGPNDGPHSFIAGSHTSNGIPQELLKKGYTRLSDEEVIRHYGPEQEIRFAAPRGTIIVEDTRGLHKGNAVLDNHRLILQLQLSNSLFGAVYPKYKLPDSVTPELAEIIKQSADIHQAYQ